MTPKLNVTRYIDAKNPNTRFGVKVSVLEVKGNDKSGFLRSERALINLMNEVVVLSARFHIK